MFGLTIGAALRYTAAHQPPGEAETGDRDRTPLR
jgi:hypothetical protein